MRKHFLPLPPPSEIIFSHESAAEHRSRPGVILIDSGPTRHQMNAQKDLFCNQMKLERNRGWFEISIISFSGSLVCREPTFRQLFSVAAWAKSARFHSWSEKKAHTRGKKVSIYLISYQSRELFRAWTRGKKFYEFYIIKCIFTCADILMSGIIFCDFTAAGVWAKADRWLGWMGNVTRWSYHSLRCFAESEQDGLKDGELSFSSADVLRDCLEREEKRRLVINERD